MKSALWISLALAACSSSNSSTTTDGPPGGGDGPRTGDAALAGDAPHGDGGGTAGRTVFVIPMENKGVANAFSDKTFLTDADASASNSTSSTAHLVTQLHAAGLEWMSYQEGMTAGTCPIASLGGTFYATKHDPFVFFQDVSGSTPSATNAYCAAHHKPYSAFAADLAAGAMPAFVFITPNLCHDMHGAAGCPSGTAAAANIAAGDTWLKTELPAILAYASTHDAIVYLIWDEGSSNQTIPFLAFGQHVKVGASTVAYSHSSLLKSIEEQLGMPVLASVTALPDFAALFQTGFFP